MTTEPELQLVCQCPQCDWEWETDELTGNEFKNIECPECFSKKYTVIAIRHLKSPEAADESMPFKSVLSESQVGEYVCPTCGISLESLDSPYDCPNCQ